MTDFARSPWCWRGCPVITRREVWLPVPIPTHHRYGHRYEVSNLGRVRRVGPRGPVLLKTYVHAGTGYLAVSIGRYDRATRLGGSRYVHQLVAKAFLGPAPRDGNAWEVDHLDFDRTSAIAQWLRWLPKNVNAWRWKFWTDHPQDTGEEPPYPDGMTREQWEAQLTENGWPVPPPPGPHDQHRHPQGATA